MPLVATAPAASLQLVERLAPERVIDEHRARLAAAAPPIRMSPQQSTA